MRVIDSHSCYQKYMVAELFGTQPDLRPLKF